MLNTDAYGVTDGTLFLLFCPFPTKFAPFCGVLDPHLIGLHRFSGLPTHQPPPKRNLNPMCDFFF